VKEDRLPARRVADLLVVERVEGGDLQQAGVERLDGRVEVTHAVSRLPPHGSLHGSEPPLARGVVLVHDVVEVVVAAKAKPAAVRRLPPIRDPGHVDPAAAHEEAPWGFLGSGSGIPLDADVHP
jgi:hypothetical protein